MASRSLRDLGPTNCHQKARDAESSNHSTAEDQEGTETNGANHQAAVDKQNMPNDLASHTAAKTTGIFDNAQQASNNNDTALPLDSTAGDSHMLGHPEVCSGGCKRGD